MQKTQWIINMIDNITKPKYHIFKPNVLDQLDLGKVSLCGSGKEIYISADVEGEKPADNELMALKTENKICFSCLHYFMMDRKAYK